MKNVILILGIIFGASFAMHAQVTDVKFLIEYNDATSLYDCKIVINEGETTTYPHRIQFNSQYTIVVPTGTTLTIDSLHAPWENNATYTGTIPCLWEFGPKEISPPITPDLDYHTVIPNLSPPSAYNDLSEGDTITIFSIAADIDPCENAIRPFENNTDPQSGEFPGGGDFINGFTMGGSTQLYSGNLYTPYEKNYISPTDSLSICLGSCVILEPNTLCLSDSLIYEWSTGETSESIEVCPTIPSNYYLFVKDSIGVILDSIPVFVDLAHPYVDSESIMVCAGSSIFLESCEGDGEWTQSPANAFGIYLESVAGGLTEVSTSEFISGTYDLIYYTPEFADTMQLTVNPKPLVNIASSEICIGESTQVATNYPSGMWVSDDPSIAYLNPSLEEAIGISPGTTTFTYTSSLGCSNTTSPLSVITDIDAQFTGPDEICIGGTTTVSPTTGGYWASADETIATVDNSGNVTGTGAGITYLVFTNATDGCLSINLQVHVQAPITELTGPNKICVGETTTIIPSTGGTWSSSNPIVASVDNFGNITGISEGNATFTFTSASTLCASYPSEKVYVSNVNYIEIEDEELCPGETTQLHTDAEGTWASADQSIATVNPNTGLVTAVGAGITTFTFTTDMGCTKSSHPLTLTVFPNKAQITGPETICVGSTTSISPATGGTWSTNFPVIVSIDENGIVTGLVEGTASLIFTDNMTGCEYDPIEITIAASLPAPNTSNNSPLCTGETLELTTDEVPGASYAWTGPDGFTSNLKNPFINNVTTASSGQYCLVVSVEDCVSEEDCTYVTVYPTPSTPLASDNGPICEGEDLELFTGFVAGALYIWTGPNGFTSTDRNPIISGAIPSDAGSYCLNLIIDGCESQVGCTDVTIKPSPYTPNAANNGPLCEGEDLHLTTDAVINATYAWTGPDGFSSTEQNPTIAGVTASLNGSFCVVVTVDGCQSFEGCTEVYINPISQSPIVSNNGPVCEGDDLFLSTDFVPGANYVWSGPAGFTSFEQNPEIANVSIADAGEYSVIVMIEGCESASSSTSVIVNFIPSTPSVSNNGPLCEGDDLEFSTDFVPGATYSWTGPNGYVSSDQNPVITNIFPMNSGTYCLIVSIDGCDSEYSCTDVVVKPTPHTPSITTDSPICEGESLNFTAESISGATYTWTGPNGYISNNQNPTISNASQADIGAYCLYVTVDGCNSEQVCADVFVNPIPTTPTASNNGPICEGDDLQLTTDNIANGYFVWTGPNNFVSFEQNPVISSVTNVNFGTYSVVVMVEGCESFPGTTNVEVNTLEEDLTILNNSPVCIGEEVEISVTEIEGATYTWTGPGALPSNSPSFSFTAGEVNEGIYEVLVESDGCSQTLTTEIVYSQTESIAVENNILCTGESTSLFPFSGGTYSMSNTDIGVINGGAFLAIKSGTTELVYTSDLNGCESAPVTITVLNCIEPVASCEDISADDIICDYNDLENIGGTLSDQISEGNQPFGELCVDGDEAHNISWLGFVALEGDYEIVVNTTNCLPYPGGVLGAQVGIYSECNFSEMNKIFCESAQGLENQIRIPSGILTKGQTYFLYIDGLDQSICDYWIDIEGFYDNTYCTDLSKVTGVAYVDDNENGVYEDGETLLRNALISLFPGNFSVLTNAEGRYIINTPKGGATLTAKMNEGHWINDELTIEDLTIFETCVEGIDFGFVPNLFYQEANISVANTVTRCDWETRFYFTVENTGTIDIDANFEFDFDAKASYFATNLIGLQVNGNTATGELGIIKPFEVKEYWIKLKMPSGSAVLPMLDFKTTLYNKEGMELDDYEQSEQLRCSYDPNDKREYPNREGEENLTLMDEDIEYTIRFQNNGNDTAFLVKIIDPLDPNIDKRSIRVISSSHAVETCIENENLIFIFENINLVDSMTNYEGSQGYVSFRCSTLEDRHENTIVHNTADIIFDTNEPIVTNTTINTLVSELCTYVTTEVDIEICEGENYNGHEESGTYTEVHPLAFGCDSTVIIHLDVQGITYSSQDIEICEGETFEINEKEYTLYESQVINDTMYNAMGCLSNVFKFNVHVNPVLLIDIDTMICEGLDYNGLTESGIYTIDSFDAVTGCDIITTIDLEVLPISDPSCIVGIDELTNTEIKIYPIPARDVFYIEGDLDINAVSIYTMNYQKIEELYFDRGLQKIQISTENLIQGLYIIAIESKGNVTYKKLIVE